MKAFAIPAGSEATRAEVPRLASSYIVVLQISRAMMFAA
jgi:hypothetical protein